MVPVVVSPELDVPGDSPRVEHTVFIGDGAKQCSWPFDSMATLVDRMQDVRSMMLPNTKGMAVDIGCTDVARYHTVMVYRWANMRKAL
jgi:hypothetical protein